MAAGAHADERDSNDAAGLCEEVGHTDGNVRGHNTGVPLNEHNEIRGHHTGAGRIVLLIVKVYYGK